MSVDSGEFARLNRSVVLAAGGTRVHVTTSPMLHSAAMYATGVSNQQTKRSRAGPSSTSGEAILQ
jgi:hypothetical protein